jgi:SAM-dependent methyltransferase
MNDDYEARTRTIWTRAAGFPPYKERHYPEHARVQEFDQYQGRRVLEYGCGGGSDTLSFFLRGNSVTFVDIVPSNVHVTFERLRQDARRLPACPIGGQLFFIPSAEGRILEKSDELPFKDDAFDLASAHGVLHHIPKPLDVLAEIRRVLEPGGLLYVMLYTEGYREKLHPRIHALQRDKHLSYEEASGWCTDAEGVPYARFYTEVEGTELLQNAGFEVLQAPVWNEGYFRTFKARVT